MTEAQTDKAVRLYGDGWTLHNVGQHGRGGSDDPASAGGASSNDPARWPQEDLSGGVENGSVSQRDAGLVWSAAIETTIRA
jgi:hypothetical protein